MNKKPLSDSGPAAAAARTHRRAYRPGFSARRQTSLAAKTWRHSSYAATAASGGGKAEGPQFRNPRVREQELILAELTLSRTEAPKGAASRAAAAWCVSFVEAGCSLSVLLPRLCASLDERDQAFAKEIVYGTLRNRRLLAATLNPLLNRSLSVKFSAVRGLLLCALYQLVYTRAPAHAIVSSSVAACVLCRCRHLSGMVNAVLRRFLREGGKLAGSDNPAVNWSFPDWLYTRLQELYPEKLGEILAASNEHAPLWIRVENSKISTQDYLKLLEKQQLSAVPSALAPGALKLEHPLPAAALPGFAQGLCAVQDLAAQLAAPLLEPAQGEYILDACAAPGGKSAHLLDLCPGIRLCCADADAARLKLAEEDFKRLGRTPEIVCCDLAQNPEGLQGEFDKILVDAPCSGTGVIRRHPDIKWLRRQKDLEQLGSIQAALLDQAFARLKPGGMLLYTTCSILKEENQDQAEAFLRRHQDAQLRPFDLGPRSGGMLQRLPGEDGGDGFFYARFLKATTP